MLYYYFFMKRKLTVILVLLFISTTCLLAQKRSVKGVVISKEENEPVIGASVLIVGTTIGTITNYDGEFVLPDVPESNTTLQISYLGMKTILAPISENMRVFMESDTQMLEEAIVIGYGSAKKLGSITGSVSTVNNRNLKSVPTAGFSDALQGQVSGLVVASSSGEPSSVASIRLRGVSSINAGVTPLFILDGSPVSQVVFTTMNPNDIENITILKDASATAIYGSRAANGVVVITSRKGKMGDKARIAFKMQYGVSNIIDNGPEMLNAEEYMSFREMLTPALANSEEWKKHKKTVIDNKINTNWSDEVFKDNAPTFNVDLSVTGGSNNNNYFISLSHNNTEGIAPLSEMQRTALRVNFETRVNDWLKVGTNTNLAYQKYNANPNAAIGLDLLNPAAFARLARPDDAARYYKVNESGAAIFGDRADYLHQPRILNPLYVDSYRDRERQNVTLNLNLFEEFTPVRGLILRAAQALEAFDYTYSSTVAPIETFTTPMGDEVEINKGSGQGQELFQRFYRFTFTNTAEYKFNVENRHFVTFLLGQEAILSKDKSFAVIVNGLTDNRLKLLSNAMSVTMPTHSVSEAVFNSAFFRGDYAFGEKYYANVSYRLDGSSRFPEKNRWAEFYSLGGKWHVKSEGFLQPVNGLMI